MFLPAALLLLAFNVQQSWSSRLFSFTLETDQAVDLMAGKYYSRETSSRICHFQSCENTCLQVITLKLTEKSSLFNKKISGGNQNRKKLICFITAQSLNNPLKEYTSCMKNTSVRGVQTVSYILDACS